MFVSSSSLRARSNVPIFQTSALFLVCSQPIYIEPYEYQKNPHFSTGNESATALLSHICPLSGTVVALFGNVTLTPRRVHGHFLSFKPPPTLLPRCTLRSLRLSALYAPGIPALQLLTRAPLCPPTPANMIHLRVSSNPKLLEVSVYHHFTRERWTLLWL